MGAAAIPFATVEEYLAIDQEVEGPFEYYDGAIIRMEASARHELLQTYLSAAVLTVARPKRCQVYAAKLLIEVSRKQCSMPDLSVFCGPLEPGLLRSGSARNPSVIFEILSPSTEGMDRGRKFIGYRTLRSLQQYVLVSQNEPRVEWYAREASGFWGFHEALGLDAKLALPALAAEIPLASIYEDIEFDPQDDL